MLGGEPPFALRTWFRGQACFDALVDCRHHEWSTAIGRAPDALSSHEALFEHASAGMEAAWRDSLAERVVSRRNLTLTHGDCYLTQFLASRDGTHVLITDFDSVSAGFATVDLTFLLATFWTTDQRRAHEVPCLRAYHDGLTRSGVVGYSFDELLDDYRMMMSFVVFDVLFDIANGSPAQYWVPKLACLTSGYNDWCRA